MSGAAIVTVLSGLVLLLAVLRAAQVLRQERGRRAGRGTEPGPGDSTIESHYSSGVSGGQSMSYRISRDPQTYAKLFIPKDRKQ
ncbi:MAG: hypothetical protein ACU0AX_08035 [Roseovarius sp.]|uniref:hypothetical protein n=1 Tax=Roseovarius sp. TaxID=1486281 RepID=UPI00405924B3